MSNHIITRRSALAGAITAAGVLSAAPARAQDEEAGPAKKKTPPPRRTYVLVHGAYHGGWCWRRVADRLEGQNQKVYAPSLTGNGDRSHLMSRDINLDTQIADIVNLVTWEDLHDVCLVAHSFGGWPASGALEKIHDRVASIVWLDAFKPDDGQKGTDFISEYSRKAMEEAMAKGEPGRKPPPAKTFSQSTKDYAWLDSKLSSQPNGPAMQAIRLTGKRETIAKKTYIRAPSYPQAAFDKAYAECKADKTWRTYIYEDTGHDVMIDRPEWVADVLMIVA